MEMPMKPAALLVTLLFGCFFEDSTSSVGDEEALPDLGGWRLPPGISDPSDGPSESSSDGSSSTSGASSGGGGSTSSGEDESSDDGSSSSSSEGSSSGESSSGSSSDGDTGSSCLHDPCSVGAQLVPTCDACVAEVCGIDNFCCSTSWDGNCVMIAADFCGCT